MKGSQYENGIVLNNKLRKREIIKVGKRHPFQQERKSFSAAA